MSNRYNQRQKRNTQGQGQGHYIAPISQNFISAVQKQTPPAPVVEKAPEPVAVQKPAPPPPAAPAEVAPDGVKEESLVSTEDSPQKPKWMGVRKKLSAKEKRVRNNMKLRKLLAPKNALMAFNELLQGTTPAEFKLENNGQNYVAEVVFNNIKYEGYGTSKNTAKNDACEKAVRDLIIAKLSKVQKHETVSKSGSDDVEMMDADGANDVDDDEDVPMLQLASFALHKLFAEWSAEGFEIPSTKLTAKSGGGGGADQSMDGSTDGAAVVGAKVGQPKKTILKTELPPNASEMHPTMLLSAMRAGISYEDLGCTGPTGNVVQNCGVTVDGRRFEGSGRSKKLARKAAATKACNEVFGTAFSEEK